MEIWRLVAPPTGTYNVVITFSADLLRYAVAGVITFTGVNQDNPLGSFSGNNATGNAANITVSSASGDLVLGVLGCETCTSVTFTAPADQRWNVSAGSGNEIGAGATNTGSSPNTTISAALGSSDHWAMGGVAIKPVGGSGNTRSGSRQFASFQSPGEELQSSDPARDVARMVKSRPRQEKGVRMLLTLSRDPGVVWRSYYFAGAVRIAMREDSDDGSQVYYILTDHGNKNRLLSSTSLTYRAGDEHVDRQWYSPWGAVRQSVGQLPTDRTFQGQRDSGWGLTHFGARLFDSHLGRFAQADSIIPGAGFTIAWDRYAGLFNNPLKYVDPSGHDPKCGPDGVFCDDNEINDLLYDPVSLTESGQKMLAIYNKLYEMTNGGFTLLQLIMLVFEREFNGYGAANFPDSIASVFAEAIGRNYWRYGDTKYGGTHSLGTMLNWLGGYNYSGKVSLWKEVFENLPSSKKTLDQIIGSARDYGKQNARYAYRLAWALLSPQEEWKIYDPNRPGGYAHYDPDDLVGIHPGRVDEFLKLKDTAAINVTKSYAYSTARTSMYYKFGISYIVTVDQADYWTSQP